MAARAVAAGRARAGQAAAALAALITLTACGHKHSDPPPTGPFSDVAGHYVATCTAESGAYVGQVAPGDTRNATISIYGVLSTTDSGGNPIQYVLHRQSDGSFLSDSRDVSASSFEVLSAPAALTSAHVTLYNTSATILGTVDYSVVKASGG